MIISIASGKGGTGKTTVALTLALSLENVQLLDADVEEPNLHLFLPPARNSMFSVCFPVPEVDEEKCTYCRKCAEVCRFEAIRDSQVDPISCEGCGVCFHVCPQGAIFMKAVQSGEWFISRTRYGPMVHAKLGVVQENSGKLVTLGGIISRRGFWFCWANGEPAEIQAGKGREE
jgi:MinD superfamily P-loop ATPase